MKPHVADWQTRVYCARVVPAGDHPVIRLAGYPVDLVMSNGEVYLTENGYEFSGLSETSDMSASSVDLDGILQLGAVSRDDLASGIYDNARVYVFATSWAAPIEDEEPLSLMFWGKVEFDDSRDTYTVQLMGAKDVLSQSVGRTYSASCPWTLFDQTIDGRIIATSRSRCTGPRANPDGPDIADYLVTGALTSVTSQNVFADSARVEVDDWFAYGEIMFTTGANVGLRPSQIKIFASGQIELHEALFYAPQVGDEYKMIPGCRKRLVEDCIGKFGNAINNGGQAHIPAPSQYGEVGRGA
ncbi:MAG TPA: DUF2163 domain-containing protein [Pseudomonas sp.]|nr:DUF2163 domain-containing protein [Pseudomonas sp.]